MTEVTLDIHMIIAVLCLALAILTLLILFGLINRGPDRPKDPHDWPPFLPPL